MLAAVKAWWMGFSKSEQIWIGIGVTFLLTLAFFLMPVKDEEERRQQIGHGVLDEAMGAAKKSLPLTPQHEQSFRERFWERITKLFN